MKKPQKMEMELRLLSPIWFFSTLWRQHTRLPFYYLPEFAQTHAIQTSHPLSPPSAAFNLSHQQSLFQWVGSWHQVAKVLEFQLQHQSFQWIFRTDFLWMDWFDLFAVQGTLKLFPQHHSSKASILWHSAFTVVQHSYPYMTTGKTIPLAIQTLSAKWYPCFLMHYIDLS